MATCRICGRPHNRYMTDGDVRCHALRCDACVARINPARAERERRARDAERCRYTLDLVDMAEAREVSA